MTARHEVPRDGAGARVDGEDLRSAEERLGPLDARRGARQAARLNRLELRYRRERARTAIDRRAQERLRRPRSAGLHAPAGDQRRAPPATHREIRSALTA